MSDVVVAWKKGIWGKNRIYPEIDNKVFLGLIRLFDADKNEQIFVHREGEKVYYAYLWKLSKFDYISLGLFTNKLCVDYYDLLRIFRTFIKEMAVNKLCVYNTKCGKIKLSSHNIQKQPRQRTLLDINIKNLKAQFDEKQKKWSNLPSQKLGILKSDIVPCTLEIQGSSWIVTQVTSGYRNVCISIHGEINSLDKNEHNKETKHTDWAEVFAVSVIVGGIISVLVNLIAPWFIPTVWPKFAVVFTFFGICFVFKALDDNSNKKIYEILGWGGVIAILLSTILTIYGLFGGFSVAEDSSGNTIVSIASEKDCNLKKLDNAVVINDQSSIEGSLSIDDRNNSQVDSSQQEPVIIEQTEKLKTIEKKPKVKIMTKEEQFRNARKNEDWNSLKKLGEEGYTPAYGILARHYMNNKKYELAHEYAQKAKNAGISEGDTILKELDDLDF